MSQQTSRKTGVKSSAQKATNTRHGTQPTPAAHKEAGAFGKEVTTAPTPRKSPKARTTKAAASKAEKEVI